MNENKNFKPVVPAHKKLPEFTPVSLMLGLLLAVVFGAANAYLGLRVGMTVSASIPAAVLSMGILRYILRRDSILENNMVQTIGSAGESLAAGAIFTMPALFMWAQESREVAMPSFTEIAAVSVCGGLLGVLFMVPLRRALIVEEHGALPFPEGTACAEVLLAGEEGGAGSKVVFAGLGLSALYKFITEGLQLFPSRVHWNIRPLRTGFGLDVLPALTGVGFICGFRVASNMFAGGVCTDSGDYTFRCGQCDRTGRGGDLFDGRLGYLGQLYPLYRCGSCCSRRYYQSDQNVSGDPSYLRRCNERDRRRRAGYPAYLEGASDGGGACRNFADRCGDMASSVGAGTAVWGDACRDFRIFLCYGVKQDGRSGGIVEQPGFRHGDRDPSDRNSTAERNRDDRLRRYGIGNLRGNRDMYCGGDGGGYLAGS